MRTSGHTHTAGGLRSSGPPQACEFGLLVQLCMEQQCGILAAGHLNYSCLHAGPALLF